ncbi:hypothetical protein ACHAXR_003367 [Thalassiosira sp. AJA248-18]
MNKSWLVILLVATTSPVMGTWSIIAINKRTNQIGSAMATCLDRDRFPENARNFLDHGFLAVPFKGGIVAQANIQDDSGPAATVGLPILRDGHAAAQSIVSAMASPESDPGSVSYQTSGGDSRTYPLYELRQYGVVTYNETSPTAAYTGSQLTPLYRLFGYTETEEISLSSVTDDYIVSVQGNIIFPGTVKATLIAFEESNNTTDFAERLFGALKGGFLATGGDVRCDYNPKLKGAVLSWLKIIEIDSTYSIDFEAEFGESQEMSALDSIEKQLISWREGEGSVSGQSTLTITPSESPSAMVSPSDSTQKEVPSQSPPISSADQSRLRVAIAIGFSVWWATFG